MLDAVPAFGPWVRGTLVGIALALIVVFGIARALDPYREDGSPRRMATHTNMGLPPCTFYDKTGVPCPSCGMTTSFALLMHGDPFNSLRANAVGTLLAVFCLGLVPWCLASAVSRRTLFVRSAERALTWVVMTFLSLMMLRWAIVLAWEWWTGSGFQG